MLNFTISDVGYHFGQTKVKRPASSVRAMSAFLIKQTYVCLTGRTSLQLFFYCLGECSVHVHVSSTVGQRIVYHNIANVFKQGYVRGCAVV